MPVKKDENGNGFKKVREVNIVVVLLIGLITLFGIIGTFFFVRPAKTESRIAQNIQEIDKLRKEHKEYAEKTDRRLGEKIDEKRLNQALEPIKEHNDRMDKKMDKIWDYLVTGKINRD